MRLLAVLSVLLLSIVVARADALDVEVDHARILKIDRSAGPIVIGNPSIVDVTVHDSHTLVLTGRSYGVTNVVVLDAAGEALLDETVTVGTSELNSVRVYRQAARTTYSCHPGCVPTATVGDTRDSFETAVDQISGRETLAKSGQ
jgi:Flp pilus assembly secretin CpaC